jgi:hypothetical protein
VTWVMWNHASFSLEIALLSMQDRCMACRKRTQKSFWTLSVVPLGDEAQVKAHFGPFGHTANLDAR